MKLRMLLQIKIGIFLLAWGTVWSQVPEDFKEIHFEYEKSSNYFINKDGVYADTLLLKLHLPMLKFQKTKHPLHENEICGFIPHKNFTEEATTKLGGALYHINERIRGVYNRKKNITVLTIVRDNSVQPTFRGFLKRKSSKGPGYFKHTMTIDYNKKTIRREYPMTSADFVFDTQLCDIVFAANKTLSGRYKEQFDDKIFENIVVLNPALDKAVTPGEIFTNNDSGIEQILSIAETITLKSFSYK